MHVHERPNHRHLTHVDNPGQLFVLIQDALEHADVELREVLMNASYMIALDRGVDIPIRYLKSQLGENSSRSTWKENGEVDADVVKACFMKYGKEYITYDQMVQLWQDLKIAPDAEDDLSTYYDKTKAYQITLSDVMNKMRKRKILQKYLNIYPYI